MRPEAYVTLKIYTNDNNFGEKPEAKLFPIIWSGI